MIKYEDLKIIAETRLKEAKVLYKNRFYDGAAYLCGYVVETALKARICKNLKIKDCPDDGKDKNVFSSHDFNRLLLLSGLQEKISLKNKRNKKLFVNWSLLTKWQPDTRYFPIGSYKKQDVEDLFKALEDSKFGFFVWIKKIMVEKLKNLIKKVEAQKGSITLFMLWRDVSEIDKWTVVISAKWIDRMSQRLVLNYWIRLLQNTLNNKELNTISRISVIKTSDRFVQFLTRALNISGGAVRFSRNQIGDYFIDDAIIFEAKKCSGY